MPLEIRQLVIKSKTVSDDSINERDDSDKPGSESDQDLLDKGPAYHLADSSNETRER